MRKIIGIIFAILLLCSSALAEGLDYSSLTTTELQDIITATSNELLKRTALSDGKLFIIDEADDLQIYLTGKGEKNWMGGYDLEIVVINNSSTDVTISFDNIVVNGWETDPFITQVQDIGAGKRKKGSLPITLDDAEISSISEVEEVEISFHTFDPSSYKTLKRYGPFTIYYDGVNWYNSPQ